MDAFHSGIPVPGPLYCARYGLLAWLTGTAKWNVAIINVTSYTCVFPALTSQKVSLWGRCMTYSSKLAPIFTQILEELNKGWSKTPGGEQKHSLESFKSEVTREQLVLISNTCKPLLVYW